MSGLEGKTVRLTRDRRRKWRVIEDKGDGYLRIVNGHAFEMRRKRVLRRDVIVDGER